MGKQGLHHPYAIRGGRTFLKDLQAQLHADGSTPKIAC